MISNEFKENDFLFLKLENSHKYTHQELQNIRESNLIDLISVLEKLEITYFLEGKTLLSIVLYKSLKLQDHDDDIGIFEDQYMQFKNLALNQLSELGFSVIRDNSDMISVLRNDRYIDIINFRQSGKYIGYGNKHFHMVHYSKLKSRSFKGSSVNIPRYSFVLLTRRYFTFLIKKLLRNIYYCLASIDDRLIYRYKTKFLSKDEFLECQFEPYNSLNWEIRKSHLELIVSRENRKVINIIHAFSSDKIDNRIVETDTTKSFNEPINVSRKFWK